MTYAVIDDMERRFGIDELIQLTDRAGTGSADFEAIEAVLVAATATMDSFLGKRHALPLASVPPLLTHYCCDIARFSLYGDGWPESVRRRYEDAMAWLRLAADGKVRIGAEIEAQGAEKLAQVVPGRAPAFGRNRQNGLR
jgi:phage gp36-like protein